MCKNTRNTHQSSNQSRYLDDNPICVPTTQNTPCKPHHKIVWVPTLEYLFIFEHIVQLPGASPPHSHTNEALSSKNLSIVNYVCPIRYLTVKTYGILVSSSGHCSQSKYNLHVMVSRSSRTHRQYSNFPNLCWTTRPVYPKT